MQMAQEESQENEGDGHDEELAINAQSQKNLGSMKKLGVSDVLESEGSDEDQKEQSEMFDEDSR